MGRSYWIDHTSFRETDKCRALPIDSLEESIERQAHEGGGMSERSVAQVTVAAAGDLVGCDERKHLPDVDVAATGGWKTVETMRACYQQVDEETMRSVVLDRHELRKVR